VVVCTNVHLTKTEQDNPEKSTVMEMVVEPTHVAF